MQNLPTVAVVTSTIGRPELERAILSVQQQTYPCRHYVFVDGEQFHQQAAEMLQKYPNVIATYLPMNTGANGWTNSSINAIAPYLIKADILCYLDDDNWYEPNHVESGVRTLAESGADYAYALRNLFDHNQRFICVDCSESLGSYSRGWRDAISFQVKQGDKISVFKSGLSTENHIDTNCYFLRHSVAKAVSLAWHTGLHNDKNVYTALRKLGLVEACTRVVSVNYVFDVLKGMGSLYEAFRNPEYTNATPELAYELCIQCIQAMSEKSIEGWGGKPIWEK